MELVLNYDKKKFNDFVMNHHYAHHMKTTFWAESQKQEFSQYTNLGFMENEELVATALVLIKKTWLGTYWYIPFGPCVDFENKAVLQEVLKKLKDWAVLNKVNFIRMEPNVMRRQHTPSGEVVPNGWDNQRITEWIKEAGFTHLGYNYGYSGNVQPRFTYIVSLEPSFEDIYANIHKTHRSVHKKNSRRGVKVELASPGDSHYLELFAAELGDKLKFASKKKSYFDKILSIYQNHHLFLLVKIDFKQALKTIEQEIEANNQLIEKAKDNPKKASFIQGCLAENEAFHKEWVQYHQYQEKYGHELVVGAALFIVLKDKSFDLYMYSTKKIPTISPPISVHVAAMEKLKDLGVKHYDLVGISGSTLPEDPYYGLHEFKRKFGGEFIEYLGEFDAICRPKRRNWYLKVHKLKRRIERKVVREVKSMKEKWS